MDFHPIVVHFPIALLVIYAILECIVLRSLLVRPWWTPLKRFLVLVGTVGLVASQVTGRMAGAEAVADGDPVTLWHQFFANISTAVFAFLAACYLLSLPAFLETEGRIPWLAVPRRLTSHPALLIPLALLGLAALILTGGFGGLMVHGTGKDPFMDWMYGILVS